MILRVVATRRIHAFEEQLPDVLSTIAGSLRVGHGLKASLQGIADEGAPPISTELRRVLVGGAARPAARGVAVAMCERLGSDDLLYVATAVEVQSQVGGSLSDLLAGAVTYCSVLRGGLRCRDPERYRLSNPRSGRKI